MSSILDPDTLLAKLLPKQQHMKADTETTRIYVAVYRLRKLMRANKLAVTELFWLRDSISDRYLGPDELLDDSIEALIEKDLDMVTYHQEMRLHVELRNEYSASLRKLNEEILSKLHHKAQ